jgi:flagellar biosynthesis protein FlhA
MATALPVATRVPGPAAAPGTAPGSAAPGGAAARGAAYLALLLRSGLGVPFGLLAVLAMMILPMPPMALDVLFTFNIALSLVIVMAVFHVRRPLEFGVFPTVLLLATLLRLALNVASTRVVLLEGHTGTGAAGKVIESFGDFVIGGNYAWWSSSSSRSSISWS